MRIQVGPSHTPVCANLTQSCLRDLKIEIGPQCPFDETVEVGIVELLPTTAPRLPVQPLPVRGIGLVRQSGAVAVSYLLQTSPQQSARIELPSFSVSYKAS